MSEMKPFEIARETLKQLTISKLLPTPLNYQAIYNEIASIAQVQPFPADALRDIAQALPAKTSVQQTQRSLLESAIDRMSWDGIKTALVAYGEFVPSSESDKGTAIAPSKSEIESTPVPAPTAELFTQIESLIRCIQPALGTDDENFAERTRDLLTVLKKPETDITTAYLTSTGAAQRTAISPKRVHVFGLKSSVSKGKSARFTRSRGWAHLVYASSLPEPTCG
jgi:diguanylate cyclase